MKLPWYMRQKLPVVLVAGLGGFFTVVDVACAQPWSATTAPNLPWKALASSADGTRLVAAAKTAEYFSLPPAPIYISTNAGATWTQTGAPSNNWASVACSADGIKLVAVASSFGPPAGPGDGLIYTSPDLGTTWTPTSAPSNTWSAVASSADGARLVAVAAPQRVWDGTNSDSVGDGTIYSSPDSGASWTQTSAPTNYWTSVASSADGTRLVAVAAPYWYWDGTNSDSVGDGTIYSSPDSGASWTQTSAPTNYWTSVASSADGAKLVAVAAPYIDGNNLVGDGAIYRSLDSGSTWTPTSAPRNYWSAVASSADGTKLVATSTVDGSHLIYASTNSGATWTATAAPVSQWSAVASSADGYRVVAASYYGPICTLPYLGPWRFADAPANAWISVAASADGTKWVALPARDSTICTSSNSGATWTLTAVPNNRWSSVASSADGAKLVAVAWIEDAPAGGDGFIYTSGNSGVTWTPTSAPSKRYWSGVASSADGTKLVAVAWADSAAGGDGLIYTSGNSGATWTQTSAPSNTWSCVASSGDGTKLVAVARYCAIYTSGNSGATWTPTSVRTDNWSSVASSSDGTKLVALSNDGFDPIISTNSGATWTPAGAPAVGSWLAVASSADGSNIVAVAGDAICTLRPPAPAPPLPPSPQLAVGLSGATLDLSWLVPSTRFVLQQDSDLGSTNWVDVPTSPTLDFTSLRHRVTLTPSLGSSYFRLKQQ